MTALGHTRDALYAIREYTLAKGAMSSLQAV